MRLVVTLLLAALASLQLVAAHSAFQRSSALLDDHDDKTPSKGCSVEGGKCDPCSGGASCVPSVSCPAALRPGAHAPVCHLPDKRRGVCCSTGQNHTTHEDLKLRSSMRFDEKSVEAAKSKSKLKIQRLLEKEQEIMKNSKYDTSVSRGQPAFGHFQSQRSVNLEKTFQTARSAMRNLFAMETLKERQGISNEQISLGVGHVVIEDSLCPPQPVCDLSHRYRSVDGTCNNLLHPTWGATHTATERLLPPNYDDGIWSPRMSALDKHIPLKSPRFVSANLLPDRDRLHSYATLITVQFGQFLAHDVSNSVTLTFPNGSAISCCSEDGKFTLPPEARHFGCLPIEIKDDHFFSHFQQNCMNFVRTQLAPNHDCSLGYAKQMNGVTHFLDMSQVYGSDQETLGKLREWSGGRMKMFNDFGRDLLPLSDDPNDCITMEQGSACFKSGDGHVNQMITLAAVHMIFTREHNRVAAILSSLNPHWSDQLLFLEARRITIAELQHVVYNEYLPLIIGDKTMSEFKLSPRPHNEYSFDYDSSVNPSLTSEFGVAAFRFGHSNVDGHIKVPNNEQLEELIAIPEVMFHPARMRVKEFYDRLLKGMTSQPMQETDPSMTKMLTKYLFRGGNPFGLDLASLNIQRSRDHGLRGYNDYRQLVGLPKLHSWQEFGPKVAEHLAVVYADVDDIDLWVGGLLEAPEEGAIVGFTFKEIIADQFSRFRRGDMYFYEHSPATNPGSFTPPQLAEIKKVTLARLVCDNSDHIELVAQSPNAFVRPDVPGNEPVACHSLPSVDLGPWKEFK